MIDGINGDFSAKGIKPAPISLTDGDAKSNSDESIHTGSQFQEKDPNAPVVSPELSIDDMKAFETYINEEEPTCAPLADTERDSLPNSENTTKSAGISGVLSGILGALIGKVKEFTGQ